MEVIRIPHLPTDLDGILIRPGSARALYVLAHGAGAGMTHPFLQDMAERLAREKIATLRFQFPYMQLGKKLPDKEPILLHALESVLVWVQGVHSDLPLYAGGKSMGGRMTSLLLSKKAYPEVRGLIFLGFPLHPAAKPSRTRAEHLAKVPQNMLFLQGTRDALSDPGYLIPVCEELGCRVRLHWLQGADHGFDVLKKSGRSPQDVRQELTCQIDHFVRR